MSEKTKRAIAKREKASRAPSKATAADPRRSTARKLARADAPKTDKA